MANVLPDAPASSMASLASGIIADAQSLFKQELALAKREVANELVKAKGAAISLAMGMVIAALGGLLLVFMLVYLLNWMASDFLPLWSCFAIVGALLVIVGGSLFLFGKKKAGDVHMMPELTIATMKDNVEWIKNQI
jgi:Putative Actinobacterial Holin-X, holin superfamily III